MSKLKKKKKKTFLVTWQMEINAKSPEKAAQKALAVHRDPASIATAFHVTTAHAGMGTDMERRFLGPLVEAIPAIADAV